MKSVFKNWGFIIFILLGGISFIACNDDTKCECSMSLFTVSSCQQSSCSIRQEAQKPAGDRDLSAKCNCNGPVSIHTVTFSLDKISSLSFALTVDGAKFREESISYTSGLFNLSDTFECMHSTSFNMVNATYPQIFDHGEIIRTSDNIITINCSPTWYSISGTLNFAPSNSNFSSAGNYLTDAGISAKYVANSDKSSITFP